jgi:hypothetical protein
MNDIKENLRAPEQEEIAHASLEMIYELAEICEPYEMAGKPKLIEFHLPQLLKNGADPEPIVQRLRERLDAEAKGIKIGTPVDDGSMTLMLAALASLHLAVEAMTTPEFGEAIRLYGEASKFFGRAQMLAARPTERLVLSINGKAGGDATQPFNRSKRARVEAWCAENFFQKKKSVDGAAGIAGPLFDVSFRTAQEWIGAWKKSNSVVVKKPTPNP